MSRLFPMIISAYDAYRPQNSLRELLPYIYLDIQKKEKDDAPVGGTFFGGLPDLAVGLRWPQNYGFLVSIFTSNQRQSYKHCDSARSTVQTFVNSLVQEIAFQLMVFSISSSKQSTEASRCCTVILITQAN